MENPSLSIIIPIYNTEKYLKQCLDSVVSQTIDDIEILCVDDGSTDGSNKILEGYERIDPRIKAIHKSNGGLVSARKAGVAAAKGKYIGFVDSDDWIEPDMYETLYRIANEKDADMVSSGYIVDGNYRSFEYDGIDPGDYKDLHRTEFLEHIIFHMQKEDLGLRGSLCCKLFRADILKQVQPLIPEDVSIAEDKMCMITFVLNCHSVTVIRDAWYHYLIHAESMSQKPNTDYLDKVNAVYRYLVSLYSNPKFTEEMRKQAELYIVQLLLKGINSRMGFSVKNLMWIHSDWMYEVPEGSSILLYGGGELGKTYYRQIQKSGRLLVCGCVDERYKDMLDYPFSVESPDRIPEFKYDYVLITMKYKPLVEKIKASLIEAGIPEDHILWFEQKEIFWKYAEDAGLCEDKVWN